MQKPLLVCLLLAITLATFAQPGKGLDLGLFKDRNQAARNAVAPGVYLVRQDYIVVDSAGKGYGYDNKETFGTYYSVGLRIKEGFLLPSTFNTPGEFDPNFEPYKQTHKTKTSHVKSRLVDSLKYADVKLADIQADVPRVNQPTTGDCFQLKDYKDVKEGKLLLVYADDMAKLNEQAAKTHILQVEELVWSDEGIAQPKNLILGGKAVIGGVLFHEEVSFGRIVYQPVAFFEMINGAWVLKAIDIKQSPAGGLNPIDKKKK